MAILLAPEKLKIGAILEFGPILARLSVFTPNIHVKMKYHCINFAYPRKLAKQIFKVCLGAKKKKIQEKERGEKKLTEKKMF